MNTLQTTTKCILKNGVQYLTVMYHNYLLKHLIPNWHENVTFFKNIFYHFHYISFLHIWHCFRDICFLSRILSLSSTSLLHYIPTSLLLIISNQTTLSAQRNVSGILHSWTVTHSPTTQQLRGILIWYNKTNSGLHIPFQNIHHRTFKHVYIILSSI